MIIKLIAKLIFLSSFVCINFSKLYAQKLVLGSEKEGLCSFYADKFEGQATSNGEPYLKDNYTAAHRTLPFNTILAVFNLETEQYIIVRVNDRGPYAKNRLIDISKMAASDLGILKNGVAKVKIRIIGFDGYQILDPIDPEGNEAELRNEL
jgi:rare lipoprotein A